MSDVGRVYIFWIVKLAKKCCYYLTFHGKTLKIIAKKFDILGVLYDNGIPVKQGSGVCFGCAYSGKSAGYARVFTYRVTPE